MTHDPDTLASAYLDGDLTDDERRAAEADPAVMAEVEQLRALRAEIADVDPPSDASREAAIGAAMAAFHEQFTPEATPAATAPTVPTDAPDGDTVVVPMWKRFTSPQWLGAAAAAVVVVVGIGVVSTIDTGDDDDSLDVAADEPAAEIMAADDGAEESTDLPDAADDRIAESELADETFAADAEEPASDDMEMATEMAPEAGGDSADADDDNDMAADDGLAGDESADAPASDGDGGVDGPPALDDPAFHFDRDVPIVGPLQLRAAAWYLLDQREAGTLGATPEYRCEFYNVLGAAFLDVDGEVREVLLEFDESDQTDRVVYAVERDGCLVVATIDLDRP